METFVLKIEYYDIIKDFSEKEKAELLDAIFQFHL
jgi:hypothetical protein